MGQFKISARVRQRSMTSDTLWASVNFFRQITIQRYFVFVSTVELPTSYIQKLPYMNAFCEYILEKIGPTHEHFQNSARKSMPSLKSVFTTIYSSRKLNNKVITTASNFWRQISCSFQVYGHTNHHNFCAKSTRKTLFWISRVFHLTNIDVTICFLPKIFPTALRG